MNLASEMNKIAREASDNNDKRIYETLIERIKNNASNGYFYIVVYPYELSERNINRLIEEGFQVEPDNYIISWEDVED